MSETWGERSVNSILESLDLPCRCLRDGDYVSVFTDSGRLEFTEGQIRHKTMDVVRAIYRGFNMAPSPHRIEAAWKSVEV